MKPAFDAAITVTLINSADTEAPLHPAPYTQHPAPYALCTPSPKLLNAMARVIWGARCRRVCGWRCRPDVGRQMGATWLGIKPEARPLAGGRYSGLYGACDHAPHGSYLGHVIGLGHLSPM